MLISIVFFFSDNRLQHLSRNSRFIKEEVDVRSCCTTFSKAWLLIFQPVQSRSFEVLYVRLLQSEKAGKAMSPISEFLGVSSKFKIASWSRLSMMLANSLAINSLYSLRAPFGLFYYFITILKKEEKFLKSPIFWYNIVIKLVINMHIRGFYEKKRSSSVNKKSDY